MTADAWFDQWGVIVWIIGSIFWALVATVHYTISPKDFDGCNEVGSWYGILFLAWPVCILLFLFISFVVGCGLAAKFIISRPRWVIDYYGKRR